MVWVFSRRVWRHGWLIVLAIASCWLIVFGTPVVASGGASVPAGPAVADEATQSLMEQGTALFAAGQLTAAAETWQQAAEQSARTDRSLEQAKALHYVALAHFNLGQWERAEQENIKSQSYLATTSEQSLLGASLNLQGQLQVVLGRPEQGIETWKQAADVYAAAGDTAGQLGTQLNQAKALQILGHYQQSQLLLDQSLTMMRQQSDLAVKATGLKLLGTTLQAVGDLERSQSLLTESLGLTQQLAATKPIFADQVSATLISLGNTLAVRDDTTNALSQYQQAAELAVQPLTHIEAQLNQLRLLVKTEQWSQAQPLIATLSDQLTALSPGRDSVYAQVNLAASWIQAIRASSFGAISEQQAAVARLLADAVQAARHISDTRAEAFALGELGHLYETVKQWNDAYQVTTEAMQLAAGLNAPDLSTAWQWQLGRILKQQGKTDDAIAAYGGAVDSLQSLRQELVALNPDLQFSFLETVEPVYRELVSLLLDANPDQPQLQQARQLIESLQLAELDNFFRHACLQAQPQLIDTVDATAAVLYPIILPDRLVVIVSRPGVPLAHYETRLPQADIEATIADLQLYLNPHFFEADQLRLSQQLYDWLIRPAEDLLVDAKTLVFVLDGTLRNLPVATLHDGQHYLIERYSLALSPGLQLLDPQRLNVDQLDVLTGGLSESQQGFSALPAVDAEINEIAATLSTTQLLNQTFTTERLKQALNDAPFSVVHLATHGQFSSKAEDTFLVTWDGRINVNDLDALLQTRNRDPKQPLELLVLSACQTAAGDKRAALGLAGMALRSGARSTLATLWQVNDASTSTLMVEFYRQLTENPGMTKASALRAAQLKLLKDPQYQQPFYWAPFVLIGNWL